MHFPKFGCIHYVFEIPLFFEIILPLCQRLSGAYWGHLNVFLTRFASIDRSAAKFQMQPNLDQGIGQEMRFWHR